jgi:hypothetical protein
MSVQLEWRVWGEDRYLGGGGGGGEWKDRQRVVVVEELFSK